MNSSKSSNVFSDSLKYPLVIKQIGTDLMISVPDFGFYETVLLTAKVTEISAKSSKINFEFDRSSQENLCNKINCLWQQIEAHLQEKKWIPDASSFKQSVQQGEEDYSLPEFTKKLQEHMNVSENTVRREIARGKIRCFQTEGGHRRIPISELKNYLDSVKTKTPEVNT